MEDYKERIQRDYTVRAGLFGSQIKTYTDPNLNKLMLDGLELLGDTTALTAIDLSCGPADSSKHLKEAGVQLYWMDLTPKMLERGVQKGNIIPGRAVNGDCVVDKGKYLPFQNEKFDVVMQRYAFHDIQNREAFLHDINRILKERGKFQVTDMCVDDSKIPEKSVKASLNMYNTYHSRKTKENLRPVWIASRSEFYNLLRETGFEPITESWYTSKVSSIEWFKENQIFEDRLKWLNAYFSEQAQNPAVRDYFNLRIEEDTARIDFPVIVLTGKKK